MARVVDVELLDFFSMEKDDNSNVLSHSNNSHRRRSFNGIQSVISNINPQLLKSVMSSAMPTAASHVDRADHSQMPLYAPVHRPSIDDGETAPLTIFYNGTVTVFDVPPHKAEGILKLAGSVLIKKPEIPTVIPPGDHLELIGSLAGDLPMARRISLQRFLEKRKERLTSATPYYWEANKTK